MARKKKPRRAAAKAVTLAAEPPRRGSRPDQKTFRDLPIRTFTDWSVSDVKSALSELEYGSFARAAMMVDAMGRDDRIGGVLDTRAKGVLGLPLGFEPPEDGKGEAIVEDLEGNWWTMAAEDDLEELLKWGIMLGVVPGELVWEFGEQWIPRVKVWHPQYLEYRWDERRYYIHTADGPVPIELGNGKWVLFTPGGGSRPWMGGLVRRLAIPWLIRNFALRDWARYSEVHGLPIRKARVPSNSKKEDKDRFLSQVADLGNESVILTPFDENAKGDEKGFDLLLEEAKGESWEGFERLLGKCESCIAITVLGQNLTTEVTGGSYAAANVHANVRQDYIEADTNGLSTTLREQAVTWWAEFNHGNRELAPWPKWKTTPPPEDGKLYQYHFEYQVVTIDEARARIGLPPLPDGAGERVPQPILPPGESAVEALSRRAFLASGDKPGQARGFIRGQLYADALADHGRGRGVEALAPDVGEVLSLIQEARDYAELREGLIKLYGKASPDELAGLMEKALLLAELAGRHAVLEDV